METTMLTISEKEIKDRLLFDNPWWDDDKKAIRYSEMPKRIYFQPFLKKIQDKSVTRAVVLMGPRRVGKTVMVLQSIHTLINQLKVDSNSILYLSLETPTYTGIGLEKIILMFNEMNNNKRDSELYIFFDEIQYLKDWEIHLKSLVDSFPSYKFIVTGSAAAALRLKSNESGAGRFSDYVLPPLTFVEYLKFIDKEKNLIRTTSPEDNSNWSYEAIDIEDLNDEFINYLNYGGYPEAVFSKSIQQDPSQFIKNDIIDKVLLRDLPSLYGINDIQELNRLFTTLAYNTGQEVSLDGLCKESGVAKNTVKRYLEYLEAAFLVKRVERIDNNSKTFARAHCFKVYLTNPSMRAALFGNVKDDSEHIGALVETAIYSQWQHSDMSTLYFARWKTGEIDIVNLNRLFKPVWMVEVKWSDRPFHDHKLLNNCIEFINKNPSIDSDPLITSKTIQKNLTYRDNEFIFIPSSLYAYTLGLNILTNEVLSN